MGEIFGSISAQKKSFLVGWHCALLLGGCSSLSRCTFLCCFWISSKCSWLCARSVFKGMIIVGVRHAHSTARKREREKAMFSRVSWQNGKENENHIHYSSSRPYLEIPIFIHTYISENYSIHYSTRYDNEALTPWVDPTSHHNFIINCIMEFTLTLVGRIGLPYHRTNKRNNHRISATPTQKK